MATLTLTFSPTNPAPGSTVTATYTLSGVPADRVLSVNGSATLDGVSQPCTGTFTLTHSQSFQAPTVTGMTFAPTADPKVWTATAPAS